MAEEKIRCKVTDTKQAILKAYKQHLDDLNTRSPSVISTAEIAKEKATTTAVSTAKAVHPQTIEDQAMLLQKSVISQIREVVDGLAERKAMFDEIDAAIAAKNNELKEVFGIEKEANALSALIEAQRRAKVEAEEEARVIIEDAETKAQELITAATQKSLMIEQTINDIKKAEDIARKRREEEYEYNFLRNKQQRENELKDALALKARSLDDREAAVALREQQANELDKKVASLENELSLTKATIEQRIKDEVEKTKKDAEKSAAIQLNIVNSKHNSDLQIKDTNITNLQETAAELRTQVQRLQADLNQANTKVQEVALRALQSQAEAARPIVFGSEQQSSKK